ncbi:hypothetical protein LTS18_008223 [Coniosporium uncinatum]|uniref:Uncharacterized protein n=1 Tax=Coniosporium uncinatum TaxID=93489 RepID=A0ACC3DNI1_9PEZI|nr:hypothetical protein LTS18_008223 [Coniosporium uncinatum]
MAVRAPKMQMTLNGQQSPVRGTTIHQSETVNGVRQYSPYTDYQWDPKKAAEGVDTLGKHLEELKESRKLSEKMLLKVAGDLAEAEHQWLKEPNSEQKVILRKACEYLGSQLGSTYTETALIDFLIMDAQKRICQLQAREHGTKCIPRGVSYLDRDSRELKFTLERLRSHLKSLNEVETGLNNIIPGVVEVPATDDAYLPPQNLIVEALRHCQQD